MNPTQELERILCKLDMIFKEINTIDQYVLLKTIMWNTSYTEKLFTVLDIEVINFSTKLSNNFEIKFKLSPTDMYDIRVKISTSKIK